MTPTPIDLPVRPPEAALVAGIILDLAEGKPLTPELRRRIAARAATLRLESLTPYFGSLARDPVHHSSYYLAVDPALLLHIAVASAPTSGAFVKPLLIGRMPRPSGHGMVINAIPFAHTDVENIERFAAHIDRDVLPKPPRGQPAEPRRIHDPALELPAAFAEFQSVVKQTGRNLASFAPARHTDPRAFQAAVIWAAIRAGWRAGYTIAPPQPS